MKARLIASALAAALSFVPIAAMAGHSDYFAGVHEVPVFVCERVELVPGLAAGRPVGGGERAAPRDVPVPGVHASICADRADG